MGRPVNIKFLKRYLINEITQHFKYLGRIYAGVQRVVGRKKWTLNSFPNISLIQKGNACTSISKGNCPFLY